MYGTTMMGLLGGGGLVPSLSYNGTTQGMSMSSANFGSYDLSKFAIAVSFVLDSNSTSWIMRHQDNSGFDSFTLGITSSGKLAFSVSKDGTPDGNGYYETSSTISNGVRYDIYAVFDYLNATAGDRIKIYNQGSAMAASTVATPTAAARTVTGSVFIGTERTSSQRFDGLMNQLAFFSGSIPAYTSIYNTDNKLTSLKQFPSLYSYLNAPGRNALDDYVLATNWTASAAAPTVTDVQP